MKLLSIGCHPVPYVQIEIYEERGRAYAQGATGLGEGGRKETGNYIYMTSKTVIPNWMCYHSLSAVSLCWFRDRYTVQSTAGSIRSWLISPRSFKRGNQ